MPHLFRDVAEEEPEWFFDLEHEKSPQDSSSCDRSSGLKHENSKVIRPEI